MQPLIWSSPHGLIFEQSNLTIVLMIRMTMFDFIEIVVPQMVAIFELVRPRPKWP